MRTLIFKIRCELGIFLMWLMYKTLPAELSVPIARSIARSKTLEALKAKLKVEKKQ